MRFVRGKKHAYGGVHYQFYDWKNSYIVTEFLEEIKECYPGKILYIIWDGWSAHKSAHIQNYLSLHPEVQILPLPTRASWLNPIERDFGLIQRFVLNNSNFETVTETINAVGNYIEKNYQLVESVFKTLFSCSRLWHVPNASAVFFF